MITVILGLGLVAVGVGVVLGGLWASWLAAVAVFTAVGGGVAGFIVAYLAWQVVIGLALSLAAGVFAILGALGRTI